MNLKKTLAALAAAATFSGAVAAEELSVAATPVPHAEILEFVKPQMAEQGVELDVKVFTDYIQPNIQVDQKRMDANFFQHQPYLCILYTSDAADERTSVEPGWCRNPKKKKK